MRKRVGSFRSVFVFVLIFVLAAFPASVDASHSWGNYHWARSSNPITISVIDSMTTSWDDNLSTAMNDWSSSSVLNLTRESGSTTTSTRRNCRPAAGKVRACNYTYGNTGWLGVAQIWANGNHITQGTAKMNDSYMASSSYSETNRQHVICQEIGHVWGLDHQDESGADLNTCMDYSDALDNPHPNAHDYAQLETIYSHLDGGAAAPDPEILNSEGLSKAPAGFAKADLQTVESWGSKVSESADGRSALFVRDFGKGFQIFTFVFWAP
ncbi:MAG TPA: hypothetical protein VHP14_13940 [Anaerolineales bacterium]|nr:hypothetical protein [Anaerolineales bacterium]